MPLRTLLLQSFSRRFLASLLEVFSCLVLHLTTIFDRYDIALFITAFGWFIFLGQLALPSSVNFLPLME